MTDEPEISENVTPNVVDKTKKPMTEERADQLRRARERALEVRRQMKAIKMEDKAKEIRKTLTPATSAPELSPTPAPSPTPEPPSERPNTPPTPEQRFPRKKKNMVVVEQSSSESEFEDSDRVIFVRRKKSEPKESKIERQPLRPPNPYMHPFMRRY